MMYGSLSTNTSILGVSYIHSLDIQVKCKKKKRHDFVLVRTCMIRTAVGSIVEHSNASPSASMLRALPSTSAIVLHERLGLDTHQHFERVKGERTSEEAEEPRQQTAPRASAIGRRGGESTDQPYACFSFNSTAYRGNRTTRIHICI